MHCVFNVLQADSVREFFEVLADNSFSFHDHLGRLLPSEAASGVNAAGEPVYDVEVSVFICCARMCTYVHVCACMCVQTCIQCANAVMQNLVQHLKALVYVSAPDPRAVPIVGHATNTRASITSTLCPQWVVNVFVTSTSLPQASCAHVCICVHMCACVCTRVLTVCQEAFDVIPVTDSDPTRVLLGRRNVPPESVANVVMGQTEDSIIRVAMKPHFTLPGEHTFENESNACRDDYAALVASKKKFIPLKSANVSYNACAHACA